MPSPNVISLKNESGTEVFSVDQSGNVSAAGTISTTGASADDFGTAGIKADVVAESTAAAGVTIDGLLVKDGYLVATDNQGVKLGTGTDLTAYHNGTNTLVNSVTGNLIVDNQAVTGHTYMDLGTDTNATSFGVRNNSGATLFDVDGTGATTISGELLTSRFVRATLAIADATGGATGAALTLDCFKMNGTTAAGAVQVLITANNNQYAPGISDASPTFGTVTKGSIVASGGGWCLAQTDSNGEFDCTVTNATDETLYFTVSPPSGGSSDLTKAVLGCISNCDGVTWSA